MANVWHEAVFVCTKEVDLDRLLRGFRGEVGEAGCMSEVEDCPDGLPVLSDDLRLPRKALEGIYPLRVGVPFPGRAILAIDPPRTKRAEVDIDSSGQRTLRAAEAAFPGATCFLVRVHGSTGCEEFRGPGSTYIQDDGSTSSDRRPGLLARLAKQLDVPGFGGIVDSVGGLSDGAVEVPLDEVDPERLRTTSATLAAAMGPAPRLPTIDAAGLYQPGRDEVQAERRAEPGRAEAEAASARQLRILGVMLLVLMGMGLLFALLAAMHRAA
jgi:hypothetical protein